MRKYLLLILLISLQLLANGQTITVLDSLGLPHPTTAKNMRYWFDDEEEMKACELISRIQTISTSSLLDGLHTIHCLAVCDDGTLTATYSAIFLKMGIESETTKARSLRYWFDDQDKFFTDEIGDGIKTLDVSYLEPGLHTLHYQIVDNLGHVSAPVSSMFMKQIDIAVNDGKNAITKYRYWMNDNSLDHVKVDIDQPTSQYHLILLLPMIKAPIRSSCFQFEVKDGVPMIYAKNELHVRFEDEKGYWTDLSKHFIDYSVVEKIMDITDLRSVQTFERPDSNCIKWFKFEAVYGDSIAIKSSQATSLQILSSTGKELYSTEGSSSVSFGGCHLYDDGTYYVAVHDVTGSVHDVTLEVQHIDRFAVLKHTPERMSGVGKNIMYFKGNGLEYVKSIELFNENLCLKPDTIIAISSDLLARFSTIEQLSSSTKLSLKLYFNNVEKNDSSTIIIDDAVTLEPVNCGDIEVSVVTENRVGDPYPIKVTLKNNGNVGSYGIPLNIAFDNVDKIDEFDFVNFKLLTSESLFQSRDFFTYTDNLLGKGVKGFFMPLLVPYLGPYEEMTYVFGVQTQINHAEFTFYAWAGRPWYAPCAVYSPNNANGARKASSTDPCDGSDSNLPDINSIFPSTPIKPINPSDNPNEPYDPNLIYGPGNAVDELTDFPISPGQLGNIGAGIGETIAGIVQGATRGRDDAVLKACGLDPNDPANDEFRFHYRNEVRSPREIMDDVFFAPPRNETSKAAGAGRKSIESLASSDCPDPDPHPTNVWRPGDPNEMTGYVSASGSHYMTDRIKNVSYDIEFENDPEIANSSAHVIVIENQFDESKFDFSSFAPKDITISGRKIELDGEQNFVKTIDLRPSINAIGELRCDYDSQKGLAKWTLTSLDPMTMEPTDDIMQGILPVNYDGKSGIGNVTYSIDLKNKFPDGTEISNKASIIFDNNEAIETPVWINIVDAVPPTSYVTDVVQQNDSLATIYFEGDDARSGVWKYDVYVQYGKGTSWEKIAECGADSSYIDFHYYDGLDYGFCVLATDSAGNVEKKELTREGEFVKVTLGDVNCDGEVNTLDASLTTGYYLEQPVAILAIAADVNGDGVINTLDVTQIIQMYLNANTASYAKPTRRRLKTNKSNNN